MTLLELRLQLVAQLVASAAGVVSGKTQQMVFHR
jgi:hypothetical protein